MSIVSQKTGLITGTTLAIRTELRWLTTATADSSDEVANGDASTTNSGHATTGVATEALLLPIALNSLQSVAAP